MKFSDEEFKDIKTSKNINLFEDEQKIVEFKKVTEAKIEREKDQMKDKPYDESSKFMGSLNEKTNTPWYLKKDAIYERKKKNYPERKLERGNEKIRDFQRD